ncbi:MAG TPA: alkene reductase [Acidobacteriaceae bacterium]|nr:alkene reductase [Acidobacteriaceae bacterium]
MPSAVATTSLFSPLTMGAYTLPNRVVMAPLTRNRARTGLVPWELNAEYYAQRSSAGFIVSEATQISQQGQGYPNTPGIYTAEQVAGWKLVTQAVHATGGHIFLQLWHVGAVSHSSYQPGGRMPVSPSGVPFHDGSVMTADGKIVPYEKPHALELPEIEEIMADFRRGAENALAAGFDGVEVHGANGYLLEQFLMSHSNLRTDEYGGSIENRARLLLQVMDTVIDVWGADRVGVRLSPWGRGFSGETDIVPVYSYVLRELSARKLAYLHLIEPHVREGSAPIPEEARSPLVTFRPLYPGVIVTAGGYKRETAIAVVENGLADAVAFGRIFIANPDLPRRLMENAPLNAYDRSTFYGGKEHGYTDYPALEE